MNVHDRMYVDMELLARTKKVLTYVHAHQRQSQIQILISSALELSLVKPIMIVLEMPSAIHKNVACVRNLMSETSAGVRYISSFTYDLIR